MSMRIAALAFTAVLLAACESTPSKTAWLMQGSAPWVGPDGKCMQLRPLAPEEKKGFCYDVMTEVYQKRHHYEVLDANEFAFLYPKVEPTAQTAYSLVPSPSDAETLANSNPDMATLPYIHQIYTALPFEFNKAHLSSRNRVALRTSFSDWQSRGIKVVSVAVTGHTDSKGSAAYNLQLSKWRAESVVYYLAKLGIPRGSIAQGGVGMAIPHPDARNDADNRYVDLRVWLAPPLGSTEKLATRDHEADAKGR